MTEDALDLVVIYGSVRHHRQGIRAARYVERLLAGRGHRVTLVDPLEVDLPLLDRMYKEYPEGEAPAVLERLAALYRRADAFVIVTGEYNHGIPPALKNLLDHFLEEYFFRPSAVCCYSAGHFGGVRAALSLRMTLCEIGMPSISSLLPVPQVARQFAEDGTPVEPETWEKRSAKWLAELEWYARALRRQRAEGLPY